MPKRSAGLLMHRGTPQARELLLVHPGGPFWANKDDGAWSIPKGEYDDAEDPLAVAIREFTEELGRRPFSGRDRSRDGRRRGPGMGGVARPEPPRMTTQV